MGDIWLKGYEKRRRGPKRLYVYILERFINDVDV